MRPTLSSTRLALLICLPIFTMFFVAALHAQSQSDRPPWARKKKSTSGSSTPASTAPASTGSSTSTSDTPPTIVNPTGSNSSDSSPADGNSAGQSTQERGRIRVSVNLVNVLASVLDDHNRPAPDLPREVFQLFEEGVEQKIEVFEQETQQPIDLALMIDASLSAHKEILTEEDAAGRFIRQVI